MSELTVRDIEWHLSTEYADSEIGDVYAEDQYLFVAGIYAKQVVDEHNGYQAMKLELRQAQERAERAEQALLRIKVAQEQRGQQDGIWAIAMVALDQYGQQEPAVPGTD